MRNATVAFIKSTQGRVVLIVLGLGLAGLLLTRGPGEERAPSAPAGEDAPSGGAGTEGTTKATLYYIAENGLELVGVEREVPFSSSTTDQARFIVREQLKPAPAPLVSAVPLDTTLRALYISDRGEAFVDFGFEMVSNHPGGSLEELFTVYAIVNALTTNLSAISAVQILVGGSEVDTLAGHIDLRHPLRANMAWVSRSTAQQTAARTTP